jgi:hypothetical protein
MKVARGRVLELAADFAKASNGLRRLRPSQIGLSLTAAHLTANDGRADCTRSSGDFAMLTLRWTLSAKRVCVVVTDSKPDGFAPLPPPAPVGLRWV